jgi:hypothetical protein
LSSLAWPSVTAYCILFTEQPSLHQHLNFTAHVSHYCR